MVELLGLRDNWRPYTHVVLLTVKKRDLFRPCYDQPKLNKATCAENSINQSEYNTWFENFKQNSITNNIPFTGLGYTFDWIKSKDPDYNGATEMIILPGSTVKVNYIYTLADFLNEINK